VVLRETAVGRGPAQGAAAPFAVASALARPDLLPGPVLIDGLAWGGAASALLIQPLR